ncbi:MAG: MMPL family transporter [Armatimonadetes bacterium]|nr:MMPL family transporter [Armatimonadota bacterium]
MFRRPLTALVIGCYRRAAAVLAAAMILFAASIAVTASGLYLEMDWSYLFSQTDPYIQRLRAYEREFPLPHDIAVLVDGGTPGERERFLDLLAERLEGEPDLFRYPFHRVTLGQLKTGGLYYLDPHQLRAIARELRFLRPYLEAFARDPKLGSLLEQFRHDLSGDAFQTLEALRLGNHLIVSLREMLEARGELQIEAPWSDLVPRSAPIPIEVDRLIEGETTFYNQLPGKRTHILLVKPGEKEESLAPAAPTVDRLRHILAELEPEFPVLRVRVTGEPVLLVDERRTCGRDAVRSSIVSLVLVSLLFALGFGELRRPAMAVFALVIGLGWTLGFSTLAVGYLNFITATYISMLVGLGIDFGIQITFRYFEERDRGNAPEQALQATMGATGMDALVGALTTSLGFLVMIFAGFKGIAQLGLIAGAGILLCYTAMVTILPACFALYEKAHAGRPVVHRGWNQTWLPAFQELALRHSRRIAAAGILFSIVCAGAATNVDFDYNLLNMQDPSLESIQTEQLMVRAGTTTVLQAISLADDLEQAESRRRGFEALPGVSLVQSVTELLPPGMQAKTPLVAMVLENARDFELPRTPPPSQEGARELRELARSVAQAEETFSALYPELTRRRGPEIRDAAKKFRQNLEKLSAVADSLGPGPLEDGVLEVQQQLFSKIGVLLEFLHKQKALVPELAGLPEGLRARTVGRTGKVQLVVFPAENVWNREPLERFLEQLMTVDPEILGFPALVRHFEEVIGHTHRVMVWYTLTAVTLVTALYLRSFTQLLLSSLPTGLGVLWMVGIMGLLGMRFNPANFVALPMIVGIGSVFGIYVIRRIQEEGTSAILTSSTGPAVILTAFTTMIGFGSLVLSHHRGVAGLGVVITVGVGGNLLASLLLLPALYRLRTGR